jgi:pimeloyl-ACP methyl ester carboxylesterase
VGARRDPGGAPRDVRRARQHRAPGARADGAAGDAAGALRLRLDLADVRALLGDYFARDLWPAVEDPAMPGELIAVVGGASRTVPEADRARLAAAPRAALHVVPDAGHWLHIDAPAAVVDLLAAGLPPA